MVFSHLEPLWNLNLKGEKSEFHESGDEDTGNHQILGLGRGGDGEVPTKVVLESDQHIGGPPFLLNPFHEPKHLPFILNPSPFRDVHSREDLGDELTRNPLGEGVLGKGLKSDERGHF
jgi:hypothetical protein